MTQIKVKHDGWGHEALNWGSEMVRRGSGQHTTATSTGKSVKFEYAGFLAIGCEDDIWELDFQYHSVSHGEHSMARCHIAGDRKKQCNMWTSDAGQTLYLAVHGTHGSPSYVKFDFVSDDCTASLFCR